MLSPSVISLLLLVFISPALGLLHRCPPPEIIAPICSCSQVGPSNDVEITCQNIKRAFDFQTVLNKLQNYVIDWLIIKKSKVFELTPGVFSKLTIHKIHFEGVEFGVLPVHSFLNGIEDWIQELQFENCKISEWLWDEGTRFYSLQTIRFLKTNLPAVMTNDTFSAFPNFVKHLQLSNTGIKDLGANALKKFGRLERLELQSNGITTYRRSTFPRPAMRLAYLSLMNNPLKSLPKDAFVEMRRLEILFLSITHLTSLHPLTFRPVWEQLEEVYFNNIILECDCDSVWLLDVRKKRVYRPPMCKSINGKNRLISEVKHVEICTEDS